MTEDLQTSSSDIQIDKLTQLQKAAIVLIAMGVENAAEIMRHLTEKESEQLSLEIAKLQNISSDTLTAAIEEFYQMMLANKYIVQGGIDYARELLEKAYGRKKADEIIGRVEAATEVSAFYLLQTVDDKQLLSFLRNEHPQTAALILANLKPSQAASILSDMPPDLQAEIAYRLGSMEKTSPELIKEIEDILRDQMGTVFGGNLSTTGGAEKVAEILNNSSRSAEKNILDTLKKRDPKLAEEVMSLMFLFEDIVKLPDHAVQLILKDVDSKTLALALKAASNELKEKIFRNMSERAAEMLRDELEYLGPVRVRDVENAQKMVLDVVRQLEEQGDIVISRGEEEEFIE